jgi:hypothetical protein
VLAESFAFVDGEEGDIAAPRTGDDAAGDPVRLKLQQIVE